MVIFNYMDPILTSIATYTAGQFVNQAIIDAGYNPVRRFFLPKKKYVHRLRQLIYQTMDEYEKIHPRKDLNKTPFYRTRVLFERLSNKILLKNLELDGIKNELEQNPNIIPPSSEELKEFFELFANKIKADRELVRLHIRENFELEIFEVSSAIQSIVQKLNEIHSDIKGIKDNVLKRESEILNESYLKELDYPVKLIENYKPKQALEFLLDLKISKWENSNDLFKYRVLANTGMCYVQLHDYDNATEYLIEAEKYDPLTAASQGFFALGYALKGDREGFERVYKKAKEIGDIVISVYSSMILLDDGISNVMDLLNRIPEDLWETPQIASTISRHLKKQNDIEGTIKWAEIAMKNDQQKPYELKGMLGCTILEMISIPVQLMTEQLSSETKGYIEQAINLLDEAWGEAPNHETKETKYFWILNRGVAKKYLGDLNGAYIDMKEASVYNQGLDTLRHLAIICAELKNFEESIETFKKIISDLDPSSDLDTTRLLLSDVYSLANKKIEAISLLKESIENSSTNKNEIEARSLLFRIYSDNGEIDNAKDILDKSIQKFPDSIVFQIDAAILSNHENNTKNITEALEKAIALVDEECDEEHIHRLGQTCFELEHFEKAIEMFERIIDKNKYSNLSNRLVKCYIKANRESEALEICKKIRLNGHLDNHLVDQELTIYQKTSDTEQALKVCEEYLTIYPSDEIILARAATFAFQKRNVTKTIDYLDRIKSLDRFRVEGIVVIIRLHLAVGLYKKGIELLYQLRRSNHDNSEVHTLYINALLQIPESETGLLEATIVEVGTSVTIESETGTITSYIIVDETESKIEIDELRANSSLGSKLMGKVVGDTIELEDVFGILNRINIIKISTKYDYAREKSFKLLETTFSSETDFRILAPKGQTEEERLEYITNMINSQAADKRKRNDELVKLYMDNILTIGHYADLQSITEIEMWTYLTQDPELGINATQLGNEKYLTCQPWIRDQKPLVLDITSIMTLHRLKNLQMLKEYSGDKLIGQNVLNCFQKFIDHNEGLGANGHLSIVESNGKFYKQEISKDEVQRNVSIIKDLLKWVNENCKCVPCNEFINLNKEVRKTIYQMLGKISAEAILIAKEHNALLYTEELTIRLFASGEYDINSVSTQEFLRVYRDIDEMPKRTYDEFTSSLLSLNYRGIWIEPNQLMVTLEDAKYSISPPFTNAAKILVDSEENSSIRVAAKFFQIAYLSISIKESRDMAIIYILNTLIEKRDKMMVYTKISLCIETEFQLLPQQKQDLKNLIRSWIKGQKLI